ncbi:hypothetical protein Tco_0672709 [Tanacetum coccineum]
MCDKRSRGRRSPTGNPKIFLQDHAVVDSGFSSHMSGNKAYLSYSEDYNGGFVAFGKHYSFKESIKEKDTDFVTPTKISASGEVQEQDISPTTLEAAKTLSQVISQKAKSTDKGIRYKRKTRSKSIEKDFNTGNEDFNTGSLGVSIGSGPVSTPSIVL